MFKLVIRKVIILFLVAFNSSIYAEEHGDAAIEVVEQLHAALLNSMQNGQTLGFEGRYNLLKPVIESNFDTPLIVKVVLSRYWKELSENQQSEFIDLFNRLSISTYAARFDSYSEESFITKNIEQLKKGRLLVKTELNSPDSDPVNLEYLVQEKQGRWYIISVIANGVNDLSLKRAEYATIIKDSGFKKLVSELEEKIKSNGKN